jgi:hypothetical protein
LGLDPPGFQGSGSLSDARNVGIGTSDEGPYLLSVWTQQGNVGGGLQFPDLDRTCNR